MCASDAVRDFFSTSNFSSDEYEICFAVCRRMAFTRLSTKSNSAIFDRRPFNGRHRPGYPVARAEVDCAWHVIGSVLELHAWPYDVFFADTNYFCTADLRVRSMVSCRTAYVFPIRQFIRSGIAFSAEGVAEDAGSFFGRGCPGNRSFLASDRNWSAPLRGAKSSTGLCKECRNYRKCFQ